MIQKGPLKYLVVFKLRVARRVFSQNLVDEQGVPPGPLERYQKFPILSRSLVMTNFVKVEIMNILQSDPDLPGCSGERILPGKSGYPVYRGDIPLISQIGGRFSSRYIGVPVNRGPVNRGPTWS
eukprot:sb/3475747/